MSRPNIENSSQQDNADLLLDHIAEETNWSDIQRDSLGELEGTIRDMVVKLRQLKEENIQLKGELKKARSAHQKLSNEHDKMREDTLSALEEVEQVIDLLAVEAK